MRSAECPLAAAQDLDWTRDEMWDVIDWKQSRPHGQDTLTMNSESANVEGRPGGIHGRGPAGMSIDSRALGPLEGRLELERVTKGQSLTQYQKLRGDVGRDVAHSS